MRWIFKIFIIVMILGPLGPLGPGPVAAQTTKQEMEPEGSRGRYSQEQGQRIALRHVPGEVLKTSLYKLGGNKRCRDEEIDGEEVEVCRHSDSRIFYEYVILVPDGSVYEVEINSSTGKLYEIEIEHLSDNPVYPFPLVPEADARATAIARVDKRVRGGRTPEILDVRIGVDQRRLVYFVDVRKFSKDIRVTIDAQKGDILDYDRL
jgi:uncharacterized membrane protein YkoI